MRPGIIIQHSRDVSRGSAFVRSDITGFIGVVTRDRWPKDVSKGDFFELVLNGYSDLLGNPLRHLVDAATRRSVQSFFENGGREARLFGLFIESQDDLMVDDPFHEIFVGLIDRLREQEDIGLLTMPVLSYLPVEFTKAGASVKHDPVLDLLLGHCREMNNRFFIIDTPKDLHEYMLRRWVRDVRRRNPKSASYGALYYPWLCDGDDVFPPSGAVAGVYARVEAEHEPFGVAWPPANEVLRGVTHPAVELRWSETGDLADVGINPILDQTGRGVVIWGARTLSTDPRWLFINSRRAISFITEQVRRDSEWLVFENQSPELWAIVRRMISSRLDQFWRAGLLSGEVAGASYQLRCDATNNPPEIRDSGQIHIEMFLRPVTTAESIVVELRLGAD